MAAMAQRIQMTQPTIKDCVKFILQHRKGKAFRDWGIMEIVLRIGLAIRNNTFCYVTNSSGELTGIMLAEIRGTEFYIINLLSIERNMPNFLTYIANTQTNITHITGMRHGWRPQKIAVSSRNYERFMKGTQ